MDQDTPQSRTKLAPRATHRACVHNFGVLALFDRLPHGAMLGRVLFVRVVNLGVEVDRLFACLVFDELPKWHYRVQVYVRTLDVSLRLAWPPVEIVMLGGRIIVLELRLESQVFNEVDENDP